MIMDLYQSIHFLIGIVVIFFQDPFDINADPESFL